MLLNKTKQSKKVCVCEEWTKLEGRQAGSMVRHYGIRKT